MPNWCYTSIAVKALKKKIDLIEKEMEQALSSNPLNADFGNEWLGNLLLHIGHDERSVAGSVIRCRGNVIDCKRSAPGQLSISTLSAWGPHVTCIKTFCRHYSRKAKVLYVADEPGNNLYWTNIPEQVNEGYRFVPIGDET